MDFSVTFRVNYNVFADAECWNSTLRRVFLLFEIYIIRYSS